jgi:Uma2 family endonuclease
MPVMSHERIMVFLFQLAVAFVGPRELGEVMPAGVRLRLRGGKYRIADVAFMSAEHETRIHEEFWDGADLVMEVLSKGKVNRERDLTKKKKDYAMARIPEYWIVDPVRKLILVYELDGDTYRVHGRFRPGQQATSALLPGFAVDVAAVFAAAQRNRKK